MTVPPTVPLGGATVPQGPSGAGLQLVWFVPALTTPTAPSIAEIASTGVFLSCIMAEPHDYGAQQNKEQRNRACLVNAVQRLGRVEYDPSELLIAYDPQDMDADVSLAYKTLQPGVTGYFLYRWGLTRDVPLTVGQLVDVVQVTIGQPMKKMPEDGNDLLVGITIAFAGAVDFDVELAA